MEFDKSKVFTALNADEVKVGSNGYFASSLAELEDAVVKQKSEVFGTVNAIQAADVDTRFFSSAYWALFYLA